MNNPVSFAVVIPVYNGAEYLGETLDSVLSQTYAPSEIFVIDDGSPRSSAEVAARYGDRIHYIQRSNNGVSATRNYGASLASADWVAFLDQDDLWCPNHLQLHAESIEQHAQADIFYSDRCLLTAGQDNAAWTLGDPVSLPTAAELPRVLLTRCPITPSSVSVRRSVFLELGGFDSRHDFCEDWDLWIRMQRNRSQFVRVAVPTMHYRILKTGNSHNPLPILHANLRVVQSDILPFLSPLRRETHGRKIVSRLEAEAAILLRQTQRPGALAMMLRSIVRHPFHQARRYKIATHLLLSGHIR